MNAVDLLHLVAKAFFAILRLFFLPNVPVYHRIFLCVFTICTTFPYKHWQLFEGVPCCFLLSLMTLFGVYDNVFLNESLLLDREKIWSSFWINILYKLYSSLFFFFIKFVCAFQNGSHSSIISTTIFFLGHLLHLY